MWTKVISLKKNLLIFQSNIQKKKNQKKKERKTIRLKDQKDMPFDHDSFKDYEYVCLSQSKLLWP